MKKTSPAIATFLCLASIVGCGGGAGNADKTGNRRVAIAPPSVPKNTVQWRNIAQQAGLKWTYHSGQSDNQNAILEVIGGGVALIDFDRDGLLDVAATGGGRLADKKVTGLPSGLFLNRGDRKFTNVSQAGLPQDGSLYTNGCHVGDFDNDGFPDLIVTGFGGLRLYHNMGDGSFVEQQQLAGLDTSAWSTSAGWGDVNGDGILDLYVCHYVNWSFDNHPFCKGPNDQRDVCSPNKFAGLDDVLFLGNGDGTFRRAGESFRLSKGGKGLAVLLGDVDLDGDLDIYVANDANNNFLYANQDGQRIIEQAVLRNVAFDPSATPNGSMGIDLGDYNGDLLPDIWVANFESETFALYENTGRGYFSHVSAKTGIESLGNLFVGFGTAFLDADRDGDEDLVVVNGHVVKYPQSGQVRQLPLMLLNDDGTRFHRLSFGPDNYFSQPHGGRGLAAGDLDNDGRWDVVVSNTDEPLAALQNLSTDKNNWLQVRLEGRQCNRDAIGAWLVLHTSDGRSQLRLVKGGGSYESHNDTAAFWGIAPDATITSLEIHWPKVGGRDATVQTVTELQPNRRVVVTQP